jgi:hypothetical protein
LNARVRLHARGNGMLRQRRIRSLLAAHSAGGRPLAAFLGAAMLALAPLAGSAGGAAGDYPEPLYLSKAQSAELSASFKLIATSGPGAPAAVPSVANGGAGVLTGSYSYLYTVYDATGGETPPSPTSASIATASNQVTVGNLPTGVYVRLYRKRSTQQFFYRVADLPANISSTYTDNNPDNPVNPVPQTQNRVRTMFSAICSAGVTCGYAEFAPGVSMPIGVDTNSTLTTTASTVPSAKGWIVDAPGNVGFAAGNWTFDVQTKSFNANGVARLVVGLWKVTTSGGTITDSTLLLDPNGAGEQTTTNMITAANTTQRITHQVALPAFTLAAGEHLYVQYWRRQTTSYSSGAADNRVATLFAYNAGAQVSQISHPAVSTLPADPTLQAPADGTLLSPGSPQLAAVFTDPDAGDMGTVDFRVCTDAAAAGTPCTNLAASGSSGTVANGATASWTVNPALPHGVYHWQARANDSVASSSWTATRSFTVDAAPADPALSAPADGFPSASSTPDLVAVFSDVDGDDGTVEFRVCTDAAAAGSQCSNSVATGTSASVADGAAASWTVAPSLAHMVYHWQARSEDEFGAQSGWTATRSFAVNAVPSEPTLTAPAAGFLSSSSTPELDAAYADTDGDDGTVEFRVCTDPAAAGAQCSNGIATDASAVVTSGSTASWTVAPALPKGTYNWQARSEDGFGARSGWTATRPLRVDGFPSAPLPLSPAAGASVVDSTPTLAASFTDPDGDAGSVRFRVCTAPVTDGTACSNAVALGDSPMVPSDGTAKWTPAAAIPDRTYYWQARAQDGVGGRSAWTATRKLIVAFHLIRIVSSKDLSCVIGGLMSTKLTLTRDAKVSAAFKTEGRFDYIRSFGVIEAGTHTVRQRLSYSLERPSTYWVRWRAVKPNRVEDAWMRISIRPLRRGEVNPPPCGPA